MIAHNNTHSTSRIFRNVELIRRENVSPDIEKRLVAIETACRECREQVDKLYNIFKEELNTKEIKTTIVHPLNTLKTQFTHEFEIRPTNKQDTNEN